MKILFIYCIILWLASSSFVFFFLGWSERNLIEYDRVEIIKVGIYYIQILIVIIIFFKLIDAQFKREKDDN